MSNFIYARSSRPCRLCHGITDCRESLAGTLHCRRTSIDYPPPGFLYVKTDAAGFPVFVELDGRGNTEASKRLAIAEHINSGKPSQRSRRSQPISKFATICTEAQPLTDAQRQWFAARHYVAPDAIDQLRYVTWRDRGDLVFVTPECNGTRDVVGCNIRTQAGVKRTHGRGGPGPDRGLFIPAGDGWRPRDGEPLIVVEGATCTLAWLTMGRGVIGRPNDKGGMEYLADFLRAEHYTGPVLIVGENDRKDDGSWPGLTGAEHCALKLAKLCDNEVGYSLPPAGHKDSREYLRAAILAHGNRINSYEADEIGTDLLHHLAAVTVYVKAIMNRPEEPALPSTPEITNRWYLLSPKLPPDTPIPRRPRCERPRTILFHHKHDTRARLCAHDCQGLTCRGCGPKKREIWCKAFRRHLLLFAADHPDTPLCLYYVQLGKQWNAAHAYLHGADFFRVNLNGDGYCLVVSTAPPGPQVSDPPPQLITPEAAIDRLCRAVAQIPKLDKSKLVTSSLGWPIEEKKPKREPQWKKVCSTVCSFAESMKVIEERKGIIVKHVASENQTWQWYGIEFIQDFGNVSYDHVAKEIVLGQILPESYTSVDAVWGDGLAGVGDTGPPEFRAW
jgi:hypothetical protein